MNKAELRRNLLQNRRPDPQKDRLVLENLLSLNEFKKADLVLTYISAESEIDTREFINKCFELGKRVAVPKIAVHKMMFYEIINLDNTIKGKFGIPEPLIIHEADSAHLNEQINNNNTFCVVPALACDKRGYRLGYGGGYYDRFLAEYIGYSAALCYFDNIIGIPVEAHDCAVDMIITERGFGFGL
ncbi:MAG: 5-formyltetrahydrofolate cyclo-ligase [Oscillospiraceae bacterium]|jgi:5-formyltetrahydrofolate cyclo-ligase|nr:5-formyltetrahydrofolate cyclo-ligase [Oscillospiraceae bacterium]